MTTEYKNIDTFGTTASDIFGVVKDLLSEREQLEARLAVIEKETSEHLVALRELTGPSFKADGQFCQIRTRGDNTFICRADKPLGRPRKTPVEE